MTSAALIVLLTQEMKGLSNYLEDVDYTNAVSDALRETGWSFDLSNGFQEYWAKQRAKRHLFFYLMSESAHKFKYEQINLQHRFDHYSSLIATMDDLFKEALEEHPEEFLDALGLGDSNTLAGIMGTKVDAGFQYNGAGEDTTYDAENVVQHFPNEQS
ncbi:MAG: hypothetical protein KAH38_08180 [Candidatus Hydrogenedentes bacterium]|nr:hypothetical protein [Candidatus Hydrogenedentota bacterium]